MDEVQKAALEAEEAAKLEAEKQAAEEQAKKGSGDTTTGTNNTDNIITGGEKKDYSQMSEEDILGDLKEKHKDASPEQLLGELAKQLKIVGHKNRAINSLKTTGKTNPEQKINLDEMDKPITRRELMELNNIKSIEALTTSFTADEAERKSILNAYNNDIIKSGNVDQDFKKAIAIANSAIVEQYKRNESISKNNENFLTNFSGGSSNNGSFSNNTPGDAIKRVTAENLKKAGYSQEEIDKTLSKI